MSQSPTAPAVDVRLVAERLAEVRRRIESASPERAVTIVAVTKGFGIDAVEAARAVGLSAIGENYSHELLAKASAVPAASPIRWHFIGALQRNKVSALAPFVDLWHTVDRPPAAEAIGRHAPGAAVLIQVNLTGSRGRSGCDWSEVPAVVDAARSAGLDVRGLMGVGADGAPEASRPVFAQLRALGAALGLAELSMGMSGDLEVAVAEGSTMVRLGTALFGPRPQRTEMQR